MRRGVAGDNNGRIWTVEIDDNHNVTLRSGWGFDTLQVIKSKRYESPDRALRSASKEIAQIKKQGYSFWALPVTTNDDGAEILTLTPSTATAAANAVPIYIPPTFGDFLHEIDTFWFSSNFGISEWFGESKEMDNMIQDRFRDKFMTWAHLDSKVYTDVCVSTPQYAAAVIVLLDQFPRHIYRHASAAVKFKLDPVALNVSCFMLTYFDVDKLIQDMNRFLFIMLPFQHSEILHVQKRGVEILDSVEKTVMTSPIPNSDKTLFVNMKQHQVNHMNIISHFGRFPKRRLPQELTLSELEYIHTYPNRPY